MNAWTKVFALFFFVATLFACGGGEEPTTTVEKITTTTGVKKSLGMTNSCVNGDVPNALLGNYLPASQLQTDVREWSAYQGYLFVSDRTIVVSFRFDETAIATFKRRTDFAFEIDVVDFNNIITGGWKFTAEFGDATVNQDISVSDNYHQLSLIVLNPHLLVKDREYKVRFDLDQPIQNRGKLKLNTDLSVSFSGSISPLCINPFFRSYDSTYPGNYFKLEVEQYSAFWYSPNSSSGVCWADKVSSGFGTCVEPRGGELESGNLNLIQDSSGHVGLLGVGIGALITDNLTPNLPDFAGTKSWLETPWGTEAYRYGLNETIKMKGRFENKGDGPCQSGEPDGIVLHAYLSFGYKEDPHSGDRAWQRVASDTISCSSLKPGDTHTDTESLIIRNYISTPGIWNIVWCADHPQNDHNNGGDHVEKHESNNCTTEAVFEVTADPIVNKPDTDLIISVIEVKGGATVLAGGGLTNLKMAIRNIGTLTPPAGKFRSSYSFCGPLPNTACTQVADDESEASNLTPGQDLWEETLVPVRIPSTLGTYLLKGCADYQGDVSESEEENNCTTKPVEVVDAKPDFIVSALGLREGTVIKSGTRVHPWCTVTNIGVGPSASPIRLAYYINTNEYRDDDNVDAVELCVGCSKTEEVENNNIKLGDRGTRTYRCCADYQGSVSESNEGNNCATMTFTVVK